MRNMVTHRRNSCLQALFYRIHQHDGKYNISFGRKFMVSEVSFLLISSLPSVSSYATNLRWKPSNPTKMTKNFFDLQDPTHFKSLQNLKSLVDSSLMTKTSHQVGQKWPLIKTRVQLEFVRFVGQTRIQVRELLIRINFPCHIHP